MLAKVSKNYYGIFGLFREETRSSVPMTRESAPFEIDDALFQRFKKEGVLEEASGDDSLPFIEKTEEEKASEDMKLDELKELAKEYGISYRVGMSKSELAEAINAADGGLPPEISAEEPE